MGTQVILRTPAPEDETVAHDATEVVLQRLWQEAIRRVEAGRQQEEEARLRAERETQRIRVRFAFD
jgi:hypothetical protein